MLDDLRTIGYDTPVDTLSGAISKELKSGTYYFNKDGEDLYYYFDKKSGSAIENTVKVDGVKYEIQSNTKADAQWNAVPKYED